MNRRSNALSAFGVVLVLISLAASAHAQEAGRIDGRLMRPDGTAVVAATVLVNETRASTLTGPDGRFVFVGVPAGTYSVSIVLGSNETVVPNVGVNPGNTTFLQQTVDWVAGFEEGLIVQGSSRRLERIVDAPAAVTTVGAAEIASRGTHGQLPKLLEFTPGAEATQSGVYDFNLNVRGFNSSLNRRVAVLVDGRDISEPFLGAQEWASVSFPLDDLATLELLRGPSAALYGANASSGILNMISKEPRFTPGGLVRITGGELGTANLDFRWAGALNDVWFARGIGGVRKSGDFSVSRRGTAEYTRPCTAAITSNCLPQEAVRLAREDDNQILFAGLRLDRYVRDAMRLTFEGGLADVAGPLFQTGIGRVQVVDAVRPWARAGVVADRYSVFAAYSRRRADEQLSLASGAVSTLDSQRLQLEGQTNWSFAGARGRVVAGASAGFEHVDTFNDAIQAQTLVFEPVSTNRQAVFGQLDWSLTEQVKLVVASRADAGSLHDFQVSPKGAVVFSPVRDHSFRVTYNKAFQVPNYSELFLQADAAPPVNLSALNALCAPFNVNCGFGVTRILAVGNEQLDVERIETWEIGYKGLLGGRALVTADFHTSDAANFITDLLPQLGTSLGRISAASVRGRRRQACLLPPPIRFVRWHRRHFRIIAMARACWRSSRTPISAT